MPSSLVRKPVIYRLITASCRNYFKLGGRRRRGCGGGLPNEQQPDAFARWLNMRGTKLELLEWDVVYRGGSATRRPSIRSRWHINVAKTNKRISDRWGCGWCQSVKLMRVPRRFDGTMKLPLLRQRLWCSSCFTEERKARIESLYMLCACLCSC